MVGDVVFKGTPGLLELVYSKSPKHYTTDGKVTYERMLNLSRAHSNPKGEKSQTKFISTLNISLKYSRPKEDRWFPV